ncbi:ATP-binding response regulator [Ottowia thiooxydans]|uniref:ATP-binding response regulator n=1 Tax=Ottowia thiooxydans TaxID=219182 RepID=UPI000425BFA3|nr:hybrid sensor histidine kinase/response regulator [Ottowia thiooxydans]
MTDRLTFLRGGPTAIGDTPARQLQLEHEALTLLTKGARAMGISSALGVPLAAWLLQGFIGAAWAWGTAALMLLATAERSYFLHRLERAKALGAIDPRRWAHGIVWRCLLVGLLFNGWNYPSMQSPEFMAAIYMFSIALMVATNAMTQLCVWPAAVWAYISPLLWGLAWQLWTVEDAHDDGRLAGGVFLLVLWGMLLASTQRFAASIQRELRTRLRNEELMDEVDEKRRQAEEASAAKSRFLAAASHDLRQPVHAMSLLGEALREQLRDTPQAPLMQQMVAGVDNFSELVDEVLDLARMDAGAVHAHIAPASAHALLARAEASFRPSAAARGLAFWLRPPAKGGELSVLADAALLWRVVGNLVANAVRYTPTGGVMLAIRRARVHGQPAWRFEVRDSGPGIPELHRDAIFDEFYQAHDAHRSRSGGEGHGLGLAVARRMARLMGTDVRLHPASALGTGSVFSITLVAAPSGATAAVPAAPTFQSPTQARLPVQPPKLHGLRVLVVDDDPAACHALQALLQGWGAQVHTAPDPASATQVARSTADAGEPLQVLITDHWLAGGALSHDVLDAVRPHAPGLRVAVVSGGASAEEAVALAQSSVTFLPKPVRPHALRDWLVLGPLPAEEKTPSL